jgi:hypothetical protein
MSAPRVPHALQTKRGFQIGEPHIVRPRLGTDRDMVAAPVVAAIDQQAGNACSSHLPERDLLLAHPPLIPLICAQGKPLRLVAWDSRSTARRSPA